MQRNPPSYLRRSDGARPSLFRPSRYRDRIAAHRAAASDPAHRTLLEPSLDHSKEDDPMPDWLPGVLSGLFLFSFIGYAFYQGFQVKPKDLPSVINEGSLINQLSKLLK